MNSSKPHSLFHFSLGKTILLWFLILSLIPLLLTAIISYNNSRNSLREAAFYTLQMVTEIKTQYVNAYFSRMRTDLEHQVMASSNVKLLLDLE